MPSAADLLAEARDLVTQAEEATDRGEKDRALRLYARAADRLMLAAEARAEEVGLRPERLNARVKGMTPEQRMSRAQAISQAKAKRTKDKFLKAVSKSQWKSANRYARERLGISPGMLTGYKDGEYAVPEAINTKIEADFEMRLPLKKQG